VESGLVKADELLDSLKEKMHSGISYVMMAGELIKRVSEIAKAKYAKKPETRKKTTKKK
jgi:hypothetical protein